MSKLKKAIGMTQDKSVSLADDLRRGACGQECLCDEAAAQLDAMQECVEALDSLMMALELPGDHCEVDQAKVRARAALSASISDRLIFRSGYG